MVILGWLCSMVCAQDRKDFMVFSLGLGEVSTTSRFNGYSYSSSENIESVSAEIGHYVSKNGAIGLSVGYSTGLPVGNNFYSNLTLLTVTPYFKFHMVNSNNFSLIGKAFVQYSNSFAGAYSTTWTLGVSPGISYRISDRLAIEAYYGMIGWSIYPVSNGSLTTFAFLINNTFGPNFTGLGLMVYL